MSETLEAIRVLGVPRWAFYRTLYRPLMRLTHSFHWCHVRPLPQIDADRRVSRCSWCGASRTDYMGYPIATDPTGDAAK